PLAALPAQLAWAVIAAASALALALAIRVAIAAVPYWRFPAAWSTPLLTAAMLCLVPVWRTIALGQVNVLLMAMVAVDVLAVTARRSRWGGLLTGVAAAVKLVPLIFIPHLLLTGKRTAAARALAVFTGCRGWRSPSPRGIPPTGRPTCFRPAGSAQRSNRTTSHSTGLSRE
ncbi:MAG TPA: glycosyltransferase family 87 protein, partial [Trebonia sp.]|nr:glycosyltransferase family 87 protein [Trebonia sp.]